MKRFTYLNETVGITAKSIISNKTTPEVGIPECNNASDHNTTNYILHQR